MSRKPATIRAQYPAEISEQMKQSGQQVEAEVQGLVDRPEFYCLAAATTNDGVSISRSSKSMRDWRRCRPSVGE